MTLIDYGWTRVDTPEAVIYTKFGHKPRVYVRHEMVRRVLVKWAEDGASELHSKVSKAYWAKEESRLFQSEIAARQWARPGARQRHGEIMRTIWAAKRAASAPP
jgi:hypothetical protein